MLMLPHLPKRHPNRGRILRSPASFTSGDSPLRLSLRSLSPVLTPAILTQWCLPCPRKSQGARHAWHSSGGRQQPNIRLVNRRCYRRGRRWFRPYGSESFSLRISSQLFFLYYYYFHCFNRFKSTQDRSSITSKTRSSTLKWRCPQGRVPSTSSSQTCPHRMRPSWMIVQISSHAIISGSLFEWKCMLRVLARPLNSSFKFYHDFPACVITFHQWFSFRFCHDQLSMLSLHYTHPQPFSFKL